MTDAEVRVVVLVMRVGAGLSLPAYLLHPAGSPPARDRSAMLVLHGHGEVEACLKVAGVQEDYHHHVAHALAVAGYTVLCPELRGFGALCELAAGDDGRSLNYWRRGRHMTYTTLTDVRGYLYLGTSTAAALTIWLRT